jgi:hypothetical protein
MQRPPRRSRLLIAGFGAASIIVLATVLVSQSLSMTVLGPSPSPSPAPPEVAGASMGPVTTGAPIGGASPGIAADSVSLVRPEFQYVGLQPWQLHREPKGAIKLEGYTSQPSYLPGDLLRVAVSTTAPTFSYSIWRVSGAGSATGPFVKVFESSQLPGHLQSPPVVDPLTMLVAATWPDDVAMAIPTSWPSDVYLIRLDSSEGVQQYVPFVVRSPARHDVLVVAGIMNWQAYNDWGGSSVYTTRVGDPVPGLGRALAVSLNRPYGQDGGAGQLFFLELPFDAWLLRQGVDASFTTDYDLSLNPDAAPFPRVVVFNGHDEYWGPRLYLWLDRHVNQVGDLGLAVLAADTGYWPVDLEDDAGSGPRTLVIPKEGPLPEALHLGASATDGGPQSYAPTASNGDDIEDRSTGFLTTIPTSGPLVGAFTDQPLFGVRYAGITSSLGRYRVGTDLPSGVLELTGLADGTSLGFIAGGEVDGVSQAADVLGPDKGAHDHRFAEARSIPGREAGTSWTAQAVWRDLPSGGRVFSAGTFYWGWALEPAWARGHAVPHGFGALTFNLLRWLARG